MPKRTYTRHNGPCQGCGHPKHEARGLCRRCYDFARTTALRQGQTLDDYLATAATLASPGRFGSDRPARHNSSGVRGVRWDKGKWRAQIRFGGRAVHLGRFDSLEQAVAAYRQAQQCIKAGLHPMTLLRRAIR
jgi:hypothetical protein